MGTYRHLLLLHLHFNPPSPLLPSVALPYPIEFKSSGISPPTTNFPDWSRRGLNSSSRVRYNFRDELFTEGTDDRYAGFRSGGASSKKRVWWLDDDDDEDDDSDSGWEVDDSKFEFPIFKVMAALGWMVPAIAVSMLVGTDQNALFMALAVPLGQTVVSLVVDKLWGRSTYEKRAQTRPWTGPRKKRPFSKAASATTRTRERKERDEEEGESRSGNGGYQSWVATDGNDDGANKKRDSKGGPRFGGWDELDRAGNEVPRTATTATMRNGRKVDGSTKTKQGNGVRMSSRRRRVRERPLLLRLLAAVFPFMSSWSGFLL